MVTRQLERRFGALPAQAVAQIAAASVDDLDTIGERLLSAQTLEEALGSQQPRT